jgi:hypothetical protein
VPDKAHYDNRAEVKNRPCSDPQEFSPRRGFVLGSKGAYRVANT